MVVLLLISCVSGSEDFTGDNTLQLTLNCPDTTISRIDSNSVITSKSAEDITEFEIIVSGGTPPIDPISEIIDIDETVIIIGVPVGTNRVFTTIGRSDDEIICFDETVIPEVTRFTNELELNCFLVLENCADDTDNDFDGLIGCEDPDCENSRCNIDDSTEGACVNGECEELEELEDNPTPNFSPSSSQPEGNFPGECSDGFDNDNDGQTDCNDSDCSFSPSCNNPDSPPPPGDDPPPPPPPGDDPPPPPPGNDNPNQGCNNGVGNDSDCQPPGNPPNNDQGENCGTPGNPCNQGNNALLPAICNN